MNEFLLNNRIKICIIGGGIVGLTAAINLLSKGFQVTVIESKKIGENSSNYNAGQILPIFASNYKQLYELMGSDNTKELLKLPYDAIKHISMIINKYHINCNFIANDYMIALDNNDFYFQLLQIQKYQEEDYIKKRFKYFSSELLYKKYKLSYKGALLVKGAYCFNSSKYIKGLAKAILEQGGKIEEESKVVNIKSDDSSQLILTNRGHINVNQVIVATNAISNLNLPIPDTAISLPTYLLVTEPISPALLLPVNFSLSSKNNIIHYYRYTENKKLLLGCHPDARMSNIEFCQKITNNIHTLFPYVSRVNVERVEEAKISITKNGLPHIGKVGENIYYIHGCSGKGLVTGTAMANAVVDAILGNTQPFDLLASIPHESFNKPSSFLFTSRLLYLQKKLTQI